MNACTRRVTRRSSLLGLVLHRSFSRTTLGLRLPQISVTLGGTTEETDRTKDSQPNTSEKSWVNVLCVAVAAMGLGFSFFSTRQLCDDPNRRALWKK